MCLSITITVGIPLRGMEAEPIQEKKHGTKRKHNELYTIKQPDSLLTSAATAFVKPSIIIFEKTLLKKRSERCSQFWENIEDMPTDVARVLLWTLCIKWQPKRIQFDASKKFKTFAMLCNNAPENRQQVIASLLGDQEIKDQFSDYDIMTSYELLSTPLLTGDSKKTIIKHFNAETSLLTLTTLIRHCKINRMKEFLDLGLKTDFYHPQTPDVGSHSRFALTTPLSHAVEMFDPEKVKLLLDHNTAIPMLSPTNNIIMHAVIMGIGKDLEIRDRIIKNIVTTLGKELFVFNAQHTRYYIFNKEEQILIPNECMSLSYTFDNFHGLRGTFTSNIYVSLQATDIFGKIFLPKSLRTSEQCIKLEDTPK